MPDWLGIVLTVALLAANAFFVAAEFALVSARRSVLEPTRTLVSNCQIGK